jgi:signal transduction histidine kinase
MKVERTAVTEDPLTERQITRGSSQDIEDFIYLISHDVRSSVRALLELPQWIVEDLEQEGFEIKGPVKNSIELLNRHTGRLDRMLVDLLAFSRIGRMQKIGRVNLTEALAEVLEGFELPNGFVIKQQFDHGYLQVGERDILTLLNALIGNAVKHHDREEGTITVTSQKAGDVTTLTVADDGPGIGDEYAERVFGAMTTLKPRDEVEGSGMGLANVRKIARLYGGDATVGLSPYVEGTQVKVSFKKEANLA